MRFRTLAAVALAVSLLATVGCTDSDSAKSKDKKPTKTTTTAAGEQVTAGISAFDVLSVDVQFATFAELAKKAGVDTTLSDEGEYTVFAPTSASFETLGAEAVTAIEDAADRLKSTVEGQIVKGRHTYTDLLAMNDQTLDTIDGRTLDVAVNGSEVTIGGALVIKSDIDSSNALIHVVDKLSTAS